MPNDEIEVDVQHTSQMNGEGNEGAGNENNDGSGNGEGNESAKGTESQFDEGKFLTEKFGVSNADEIKQALVLGKNYKTLESHIGIAEKIAKNPNLKSFVDYVDGGGRDVPFIWNLVNTKVDDLSNFDALVLKDLFENKDPETTREIIETVLKDKYKMDSEDLKDKDASKYMLGKDGAVAKEFLKDQQAKYTLKDPEKEKIANQQSENERIQSWQPAIKGHEGIGLKQQLKSGDIDFPVDFKWTPDEKANTLYQQILSQTIKDVGLPYSDKNLAIVQQLSNSIFVAQYLPQIIQAAMSQTLTAAHKKFAEKYNGIQPENGTEIIPGNGQGEEITVSRHETPKKGNYW